MEAEYHLKRADVWVDLFQAEYPNIRPFMFGCLGEYHLKRAEVCDACLPKENIPGGFSKVCYVYRG